MMNISLNDPFIKICAFSSVFETIGRPMVFIASLSKNKTQIVLDTGAGANCINPKFLEDKNVQLLSEYLFPKSLKIQVGNSQTTNITKAVLVEMKTTNNKALFWFLVVEHLPMNALIGRPSAVKEFIHYDQEGQIWWHNELLQSVVGEVMKERRRRERERLINLSTWGCVIQLYLWENTQFIEIREFGWGFLMLTS